MRHVQSRVTFVVLALIAMFAFVGLHAPAAFAQGSSDSCPLEAPVSSLHACVDHAAAMGVIDDHGVARSLLAKLDAAQAALDRDPPSVAVQLIQAFENKVNAQAGKHIDAEHAEHMLMHAQLVIQALEGSQ